MLADDKCLLNTGKFIIIVMIGNRNTGLLIQVACLIEVATKTGLLHAAKLSAAVGKLTLRLQCATNLSGQLFVS